MTFAEFKAGKYGASHAAIAALVVTAAMLVTLATGLPKAAIALAAVGVSYAYYRRESLGGRRSMARWTTDNWEDFTAPLGTALGLALVYALVL